MPTKKKEQITNPEQLSEGEIWDILKFSQAIGGFNDNFYNVLTPMLLNKQMQSLNLNPAEASERTLIEALKDVRNSEEALQQFSQDFEIRSQPYKKLLAYLGNLLSFDMSYNCINAKSSDYTGKAYSSDLDVCKKFFDQFNYRKEFSTVVKELLRNEAFFCCPRFDLGDQAVLQELPSSPTYTMITGRNGYSLAFSMSMLYYILPGIDVRLFPDFFIQKYSEYWQKTNGFKGYNPSLPAELRGASSWVYWQDIPIDVGWVFKFDEFSATRVPRFTGMFLDLVQQPLMRSLQKNLNMSSAARLILGQVGTLKDSQAKLKDNFNISPQLLGNFLALVKSAIGESLNVAALPLDSITSVAFPVEGSLYSNYLKSSLSTSGVSTSLIFDEGNNRTNAIQISLAVNNDENDLYALYPQFENFLNYQVNKLTKKFKFKFHFEGSQFYNNRQQRFDKQMTLAQNGIVLPSQIASACGYNPFDFQRQLEEAQATGWVDKLTPILSSFQMGKGSQNSPTGRPKSSDSEISDSGEQTRSDGENIGRGGKSTV